MSDPKYTDSVERWNKIQALVEEVDITEATAKKRKYIRRVDDEKRGAHYWTVNIIYDGERYNKTFADIKNGDRSSALLAALGWRDKLIKELGIVFQKGLKKPPTHPRSKGVYFKVKKNGDNRYSYHVCYWHEEVDGKRVRKYKAFSTHKYGPLRSRQKAIKFRKEKLKELYG